QLIVRTSTLLRLHARDTLSTVVGQGRGRTLAPRGLGSPWVCGCSEPNQFSDLTWILLTTSRTPSVLAASCSARSLLACESASPFSSTTPFSVLTLIDRPAVS